jgi:phage baseplate assembly protein W
MSGYSPKLPLTRDLIDGYGTNKSIRAVAKQNFKMLVLTNPGERVMHLDFGVGIKRYLFESMTQSTYAEIDSRIRQQVSTFLPYLEIRSINFNAGLGTLDTRPGFEIDSNSLSVQIIYSILPLGGATDALQMLI